MAMLAAIHTQHRPLLEVAQLQWPQFHIGLATQQRLDLLTLCGRHKSHRSLVGQANMARAVVGCQPEFDFRACRRIAPMPGQEQTLL
ncbi:hypothetical protein D9M71_630770 [compost metagenome]